MFSLFVSQTIEWRNTLPLKEKPCYQQQDGQLWWVFVHFFSIGSKKEKIFYLNEVVRLKSKAQKSSDGLCFKTTLGKHLSNVTRRYRIVTSVVFVVVIGSTSCKRSLQVSTNPTSARTYKKNARTSAITCTALDYTISRRARRGKNLVIISTRSRGIP